jgi:hypothetical protein
VNVLIPESASPLGTELAQTTRRLGHSVLECHTIDAADVRCLADRGLPCPLDTAAIDVVVLNGRAGGDTLTCAQRRRVPVAFVFRPDRRSVSAAIADATDDLGAHARVAEAAMRQALTFRGIDPDDASAAVRRRSGGLIVQLRLPDALPASSANAIAVIVHDSLRQFDRWAGAVDIAVAS